MLIIMWGKGGQFVIVKPSKNLLMVTTADPSDDYGLGLNSALDIFDRIDGIAE